MLLGGRGDSIHVDVLHLKNLIQPSVGGSSGLCERSR